jgi:hypothetical protein
MNKPPLWIWIRIAVDTMWSAIRALKSEAADRHEEARLEEDHRTRLEKRAEGDYLDKQAEELRRAMLKGIEKPLPDVPKPKDE